MAACHFNNPASRRHARSPGFSADTHACLPPPRRRILFGEEAHGLFRAHCAPHAENPSEAGEPQAGPKPRNSGAYKC